jgi:carboxyl-terminal processing protease
MAYLLKTEMGGPLTGGTLLQSRHHLWRRGLLLTVLMLPLAYFTVPATADPSGNPIKGLLAQAEQYERLGDWEKAADRYEEILRLNRKQAGIKEKYSYCLRRYFQVVRLRDTSYRKDVLSLGYPQAMRMYEIVLYNLLNNTLDKQKVDAGRLFHTGLDEYQHALGNVDFCVDHLGGLKPNHTKKFRQLLHDAFAHRAVFTYEEAVEAVRQVVMKSTNTFPDINATTIVMEFMCGACYALDEYTVYLTPRQLRELCDTLKGRYIGVGIRLKSEDNKLLIADILPDSPAAEAMPALARDDQIVSIDTKLTGGMPLEVAMAMLEGDEGSVVEIGVSSPTHGLRIVELRRRPLFVPSVTFDLLEAGVGYIKIHCFQETTLREFETKLLELTKTNAKTLVLDLRGNPGGLLDVAIDIAVRFLPSGSLVVSQVHHNSKETKTFRSQNMAPLGMPLVVLVDADTASAAEVLAGALKENKRARLIGQTTYGKGCAQGLLKLPHQGALRSPPEPSVGPGTGAIRITIARFFSPTGQAYSGRGVEPDIVAEGDSVLYQAREEALRLLAMQ